MADNLPANAMQTYKDTDEYYSVDRIGIRYMDFNTEHAPFDNKLVRQAFAMSIDRQLLIDRILETSESAVLGFVPKAQPSLSDSTKSYREVAGDMFSEDVAKAQELLAEAGSQWRRHRHHTAGSIRLHRQQGPGSGAAEHVEDQPERKHRDRYL